VAEALQSTVRVHRQLAAEIERALEDFLPRGTAFRELEILVDEELGRREAIVHLSHRELFARVRDAGLRVGVAARRVDLGEGGVVVRRVGVARAIPCDQRQRFDVERLICVVVRVLGAHHDGGGRTVGDAGTVRTRRARRPSTAPRRWFPSRPSRLNCARWVASTVVVFFHAMRARTSRTCSSSSRTSARMPVRTSRHRGRGQRAGGPVRRALRGTDEALVAAVLHLLDTDRHRAVVRAGCDCVGRIAQRSEPVAQKFSTWVTGLSCSWSGRASAMPLIPEKAVPSQYASTSSLVRPAEANVSLDASSSRSSVLLFHCSPNDVQPMPTIATRSLMPCEPTGAPYVDGGARWAPVCSLRSPALMGRAFQK